MGRGRTGTSKIVPPVGWRWAPKPNARARCMRRELLGKTGGGRAGQLERFVNASGACKVKG